MHARALGLLAVCANKTSVSII